MARRMNDAVLDLDTTQVADLVQEAAAIEGVEVPGIPNCRQN